MNDAQGVTVFAPTNAAFELARAEAQQRDAFAAKLGANFMIASAIEAIGEAASLVEGYNVSGRSLLEMITSTLFLGPVHAGYGHMIANQQYEPAGFKMTLALKDVRLVLEAAEQAVMPMPFASVLKDNLLGCHCARGRGL